MAYGVIAPAASLITLFAWPKHIVVPIIPALALILGAIAAVAFGPDILRMWDLDSGAFVRGAAFGVVACLVIWIESSFKSARSIIRTCSIAVIITALVATALAHKAVNGSLDWIMTFSVYVGPAIRVMAGGLPLVDTFSQYGVVPFLLFAGAFSTVIAPSYPSAAFVVSVVNAVYVLVAIVIMMRVVRLWTLVALAAALLTIGIVSAWGGIPQAGGLRFLPPLLTVAALVFQPSERRLSIPLISALLLSSFWSIEAFVWSFLTAVCTVGGRTLYERAPMREFLRCVGSAAIFIIGTHAIFSVLTYVGAGQWPRYDIYFDMVDQFRTMGWASVPFSTETPMWIVEAVIYFTGLALAFATILKPQAGRPLDGMIMGAVLPLAVTGLLGMSYWVGRPLEFNLWPTIVPAIIIAIIAADRLIARSVGVALLVMCAVIVLSATMNVFAIIAASGFSELVSGSVDIRQYVSAKIEYLQSLKETPDKPSAYDPVAWDAVELVRKYEPQQKDIVLFIQMLREVPVYLLTKHRDAFGLSSFADNISPKFVAERQATVDAVVGAGTYVFIQKSFADYFWGRRITGPTDWYFSYTQFQNLSYKKIHAKFDLCIIEESPNGMLATVTRLKSESCAELYDPS